VLRDRLAREIDERLEARPEFADLVADRDAVRAEFRGHRDALHAPALDFLLHHADRDDADRRGVGDSPHAATGGNAHAPLTADVNLHKPSIRSRLSDSGSSIRPLVQMSSTSRADPTRASGSTDQAARGTASPSRPDIRCAPRDE
jgi:hypothetical protein